ncbi:hypothetical protein [uncultured Erythrobacter sp.]|uniref:hypothetical protein n=1 Tax=uncultured Erythrobacter sp. TaxID=263913 RepID=UPI002630DFC2|nr:hypothetical protein [uncultured Erythrobacter sp.]
MNAPTTPLTDELKAALQWWQMAGVEHDFSDDATDWLAGEDAVTAQSAGDAAENAPATRRNQGQVGSASPQKSEVARIALMGELPPDTLEVFCKWWLEAPGLDAIGPRGRIAPRGVAKPDLMVLVLDPEEQDRDHLLSGPRGKLLANMLAAMGISSERTYFASALPRHTPVADTASLAASGLDDVTLHHIGLVSPQKLVVFGSDILPLLKQDVSNPETSLREINQNSAEVPLLVSEGLDSLLAMPRLKARFWRRWIEWSVDLK